MKMRFISAIRLTAAGVILLASSSLALAQSNDVEHGMQVFKQCAPCHATTNKTRVGPGLAGIVGRHAGSMPGFRYSHAMKNANIVWDGKTLDAYLASPQKVVPGNRMAFSGIPKADDRAALIAYLATLKAAHLASAPGGK